MDFVVSFKIGLAYCDGYKRMDNTKGQNAATFNKVFEIEVQFRFSKIVIEIKE